MTKKKAHTDTTVPHVPADERDIMAALLRTPPPSKAEQADKSKGKRRKRKRR